MTPRRVQRKRTKGYKLPPNTVCVSRPHRFGNPFYVGKPCPEKGTDNACGDRNEAVNRYSKMMFPYSHTNGDLDKLFISLANMKDIQHELRGKNLACWCPEGEPCHADILLEVANGPLIED